MIGDPFDPDSIDPRSSSMGSVPDASAIPSEELLTFEEALLLGEPDEDQDSPEHLQNLAEVMDEDKLQDLGDELCRLVKEDDESRADWKQRFARGLEILGIKEANWEKGEELFEGCSKVVHPLIMEAVVQYQARAVEELFPATGPVKAVILGHEDNERRVKADRVQDHMNYQLTQEDLTYFKETGKLHMYLPIFGSAYRKGYHDPITDRNILRFVSAEDLILPYNARSLQESPRITHKFDLTENEVKAYIANEYFRDVETEPSEPEDDAAKSALAEIEGREKTTTKDNQVFEIFECDCFLDLPGYESKDGVALPYVVTMDSNDGTVYSIYRNYDESDFLKERTKRFAEYGFVPGLGAYSFGYIHMIGSLAQAATGTLRALLDSAAFSNVQGGFKAKDSNTQAGEVSLEPGVWKDVDMTAEELRNAFYTPPFKEPSAALFSLLSFLSEEGRRFASVTNVMAGDGENYGPVGTTVALIEQASKVYSGINKRAHASAAEEFRILYRLNAENTPEEGYPYAVEGADRAVYRSDYTEGVVEVVPVSDPNIFSTTLRIAQAQALIQMSQTFPHLYNQREVNRRMLEAMRVASIDDVLLDPENVPEMDAVTENVAMLSNRPVKALEHQDHMAHLAVHMSFQTHPQFGGLPQAQQTIGPAMMAHMAEHLGLLYAQRNREMGVPVPSINLATQPGEAINPPGGEEYEQQITQSAAQMVQQFMQQSGLQAPPQQEEQPDPILQAKLQLEQIKGQNLQAKGQMDMQMAQQKAQSDQQKAMMDAQSKQQDAAIKQQMAQMQAQITQQKMQIDAQKAQMDAQTAQRKAEAELAQTQSQIELARAAGQQEMQIDKAAGIQEMDLDQAAAEQEMDLDREAFDQKLIMEQDKFAQERRQAEEKAAADARHADAKAKAAATAAAKKGPPATKKPGTKKNG